MTRWLGVVGIAAVAWAISGCSTATIPSGSAALGYQDGGNPSDQVLQLAQSPKARGLAAGAEPDAAEEDVAAAKPVPLKSSAKAPKGALADRDYSGAALDPDAALAAVNAYRAEKGLRALKLDARLTAAAKAHSRDLASGDRISHYGSDGSSPWDRVAKTGYPAALAAENVGTGQATMEEVIKGWKGSPAHDKNLLLADAEDMGIALVRNPKSEFKTFWTLVVGTSQ